MHIIDFKKLKRQMIIYRVVQAILMSLLVILAVAFQGQFAAIDRSGQFVGSILTAIVVQFLLIWPVYKLAWRDAAVEIEGSTPDLSTVQLAALRKKRLIGDMWKFCGVAFFVVFVTLAPDAKKSVGAIPVLASIMFSFLLTCLMYFQCFNFSAKKQMKSIS